MDTFWEMLAERAGHMIARSDGPLYFRLVVMPLVVASFAVRAGLRDARERHQTFLRTVLANPDRRPELLRQAMREIGRIFIVALVLDTIYQLTVLRAFYPGELLVVAVSCTIVPYVLVRGPAALLATGLHRLQAGPAPQAGADAGKEPEDRRKD